jgi:hypothetical protein
VRGVASGGSKTGNTGGRLSKQLEGGKLRKVKILVVTVVATLLVASPAFANAINADVGFLTETDVHGSGFDLDAGSIIARGVDAP